MYDLTIGQKRRFTFSEKEFEIKEILDNPNIRLQWTWNTGVCPHCKERIERKIDHLFYRIEILVDTTKKLDDITIDDIVIMGDTTDKRRLILPKDKYTDVFNISKDFKKFISTGD